MTTRVADSRVPFRTPAPYRRLLGCVLFGASYALLARLGFSYSSLAHNVTLIWAPTGLSLFVLLRWGPGLWPGIVLGDLIANLNSGTPWLAVLGITAGNVAQSLLGWHALRRIGFRPTLERTQDAFALLLLGTAATTVSATAGIAALWGAGILAAAALPAAWMHWVMGDATGVAVLTPWLLAWQRFDARALVRRRLEAASWLLLLGLVCALVFSAGSTAWPWARATTLPRWPCFPS